MYWSNWLSYAGDLTQEMRDIAWQYQSSTSGVATQAPRWQTCLSKSVNAFGFAAAHEYVITNFEETAKAEVSQFTESYLAFTHIDSCRCGNVFYNRKWHI